jgi:hypothetical protein
VFWFLAVVVLPCWLNQYWACGLRRRGRPCCITHWAGGLSGRWRFNMPDLLGLFLGVALNKRKHWWVCRLPRAGWYRKTRGCVSSAHVLAHLDSCV